MYGKARVRLYRKHRSRRSQMFRNDPIMIVYPLFLLGLPLTLVFPFYPLASPHPGVAEPFPRDRPGASRPPVVRRRSPRGTGGTMKILVLPLEKSNPYQDLLYGAMRPHGARNQLPGRLTPSKTLNVLLLPAGDGDAAVGGARVVHLHWVYAFGPASVAQVSSGQARHGGVVRRSGCGHCDRSGCAWCGPRTTCSR